MASITDYARMCRAHAHCEDCPMIDLREGECRETIVYHTEECEEIIDKWCAEHPQKTYKQDFLEKFPKAACGFGCRRSIYEGLEACQTPERSCNDCWNEVMMQEDNNDNN